MWKWVSAALVAVLVLLAGPALATDCSGTITAGGTAQAISAVNGNTRGLFVMNNSAEVMCVAWSGSAATIAGTNCGAGSYALSAGSATAAGGSMTLPTNIRINSLSIIAATTGSRFSSAFSETPNPLGDPSVVNANTATSMVQCNWSVLSTTGGTVVCKAPLLSLTIALGPLTILPSAADGLVVAGTAVQPL